MQGFVAGHYTRDDYVIPLDAQARTVTLNDAANLLHRPVEFKAESGHQLKS